MYEINPPASSNQTIPAAGNGRGLGRRGHLHVGVA